MSDSPSPFSQPVHSTPPQNGSSENLVKIIVIIALTMLLMCGGLIGLGFYAVNRIAEKFEEFVEDIGVWDDADAVVALEFALEDNTVIGDRVGEIQEVVEQPDLTYDDNAGVDDYFYRVIGTEGDALVVVQFDYDNDRNWFTQVELVEGDAISDPRSPLATRSVPFDSLWSKHVYDVLVADGGAAAQSLAVGAIQWVYYDFEGSESLASDTELFFDVYGDSGSQRVIVRFRDLDFDSIEAIHRVDDEDNAGESIYQASDGVASEA